MIGLAIRFDLGRYHATPWGSHVNDAAVEWPPSPWRILRALYAASRTNALAEPQRDAVDHALARLVTAGPPSFELPAASAYHTRHYMPSREFPLASQGKDNTAKVLDGFLALDPDAELTAWWDVVLTQEERTGLEAAAASLGYLGRSESVCSARVRADGTRREIAAQPLTTGEHVEEGELVSLLCPTGSDPLPALTVSVTELRNRRLLSPPGADWIDYTLRRPIAQRPRSSSQDRPSLARFRVRGGSRPGMRDAVALAHSVRAALQSRFGQRHDNAASPVFSGRAGESARADQHRHAHYLVTPDEDGRRAGHVVVWAPEGFGSEEIAALADLTRLHIREAKPLRLALTTLGDPEQIQLPSFLGPSRTWRSLTPFGLTRHPKQRRGEIVDGPVDQIRRELALREQFPEPETIELLRGSWLEYRRSRPGSPRLEAPQVVGARIVFPEEVLGPIAIGALSHFGLGVFVPEP